ncbi:MAG: winged helix-turn-helix transcriptional regulator [Bacteroidaceae bacterium]|nr:winged helix-turn-helix transcriptional regulator [Bacteroidaceae bacterium]
MELDFDVSLIFAILNGKVFTAMNKKLQKKFIEGGLRITPEQWTVLFFLSEEDLITQRQLCDRVYKDKPSMTRIINMMEAENLVERRLNFEDHRSNLIHLTAYGRAVRDRAEKIALITLKESLRGLGLSDIHIAQEVLRRIFLNIANQKG